MKPPQFQPSTVPVGEYVCEIAGEPEEKQSQFDSAKSYLVVKMNLQNQRGEHFPFDWTFNEKTPMYGKLLILLGGKEHHSGIIDPPPTWIGQKFVASIIERSAKNDKNKLVNEIVRVASYEPVVPPAIPDEVPTSEVQPEDGDPGVDVPF